MSFYSNLTLGCPPSPYSEQIELIFGETSRKPGKFLTVSGEVLFKNIQQEGNMMVTADQLALQLRQKQMEQENNLALEERQPTGLFDPFLHETVRHALTDLALEMKSTYKPVIKVHNFLNFMDEASAAKHIRFLLKLRNVAAKLNINKQ